ncbi:MAG: nucleotidyl transferase AbiEii/AbiGii toxin family protein [Pseudomonadota bacterium]
MNSATEQRIKSKLKTISKERNISFNLLLEALFFERFLARLAKSPHKDNLIFKGGQCLAQYINLGRETRDIDFLLQRVKSSKDEVKTIFDEIVAINLEDEFQFLDVKVIAYIPHLNGA